MILPEIYIDGAQDWCVDSWMEKRREVCYINSDGNQLIDNGIVDTGREKCVESVSRMGHGVLYITVNELQPDERAS